MNFDFSPAEESFRREVRDFIARELPPDIRDRVRAGLPISKEDTVRWQKIAFVRGWIELGTKRQRANPWLESLAPQAFDVAHAASEAVLALYVVIFAAIGGVVLLAEPITARLLLSSVAILGGIALTINRKN